MRYKVIISFNKAGDYKDGFECAGGPRIGGMVIHWTETLTIFYPLVKPDIRIGLKKEEGD